MKTLKSQEVKLNMPIKKDTLAKYINPVLIETGTYLGTTIEAAIKLGFNKIFSIEIDEILYQKACEKFAHQSSVELLYGDTLKWLPNILANLENSATFWLNVHRSDVLPGGKVAYPIIEELEIIAKHYIKNHTILIDERRLLEKPWPITETDVHKAIFQINPKYKISYESGVIEDDIIVAKLPETVQLKNAPQASLKEHINQGDLYVQKQQWNKAINAYLQAIKIDPNFPWHYQKLGEVFLQLNKWNEAVNAYRQVIEKEPNFPWSYNKLGDALMELKNWQEAINAYRNFIKLKPDFPWVYNKLGKALMELKNWQEAIAVYQQAIEIDPNLYFAHHNLGLALVELKKWNKAIIAYGQAIKIKPDSYWSHYNLGQIFIGLKKWDKAVETYRYAIENDPNSPWYYQYLGMALKKQGKTEEAIACYRKAIEIKSDWHQFYSLLGDALLEIGQPDEAIACYLKAIKLQPDAIAAYEKLRGIYSFQLAQFKPTQSEELIQCYQTVIQLQPNFPEAYINLADILTEKGELDTAINYYQKATYNKLLVSHPKFVKNHWNSQQLGQPSFIIIGTPKGGTSSLYSYLCHHPNVIPALQKEINFFSKKFHKGIDWYLAHFPQLPQQGKFITGEATPNYMYSDEVGKNLLDNFPKIKIIAILRNPVDRTISHFYMAKSLGKESKEFTEFVPQEMKILTEINDNPQNYQKLINKMSAYFRASLYIHFLKKWINIFPREQLLILKSEDMYENPTATTKQVFNFLGLPNYQLLEYKKYFPGSYPPIDASLRRQLSELFQPYNQKLEAYLNMKFNWE